MAVGVLDMALWDLAAKLAGVPLYRLLATRFGDGTWEDRVFAYAAGGYYARRDARSRHSAPRCAAISTRATPTSS